MPILAPSATNAGLARYPSQLRAVEIKPTRHLCSGTGDLPLGDDKTASVEVSERSPVEIQRTSARIAQFSTGDREVAPQPRADQAHFTDSSKSAAEHPALDRHASARKRPACWVAQLGAPQVEKSGDPRMLEPDFPVDGQALAHEGAAYYRVVSIQRLWPWQAADPSAR